MMLAVRERYTRYIDLLLKLKAPKHKPISQSTVPTGTTTTVVVASSPATAASFPAANANHPTLAASPSIPNTNAVPSVPVALVQSGANLNPITGNLATTVPIQITTLGQISQCHPLEVKWIYEVCPILRRMLDLNFSGEYVQVDCSGISGTTPQERLIIRIRCRNPKTMREAIDKIRCIDPDEFVMVIETKEGNRMRYLAQHGQSSDLDGNLLRAPNWPRCASGFPVQSFRDGKLVGTAVVGGTLLIDGRVFGITSFHFLLKPFEHFSTLEDSLNGIDAFLQPWAPQGVADAADRAIKVPIYSASGTRLSKSSYISFKGPVDGVHCIMDWGLIYLQGIDAPSVANCYIEGNNEGSEEHETRTIRATASPGGKSVYILAKGSVYCKGQTSGIPSLTGYFTPISETLRDIQQTLGAEKVELAPPTATRTANSPVDISDFTSGIEKPEIVLPLSNDTSSHFQSRTEAEIAPAPPILEYLEEMALKQHILSLGEILHKTKVKV
ncbi:hypothetical protein K440DRAFT_664996 [Wilcoxina mikolae CBS 423.85]|nr:hypothetical protein K440DRAFT_664996 [Wilcoxina mikolae CBS 423.85]